MQEQDIDITTADGAMNTFITHPHGDGPYPIILFLMDAPDKREEMFGHMNALSNAMVCEDIQVLLDHASEDACASDGPIGCVGYERVGWRRNTRHGAPLSDSA